MPITDKQAAKVRIQQWLQDQYRFAEAVPQICDEKTVERDFGWVFYFRAPVRPSARPAPPRSCVDYPPVAIRRQDGAIVIDPPGPAFGR